MKYSKKWKVVPYEQVTETIQQNDANELEKLKQILENPSTSEEEKYNLYNSKFKSFLDKKSNRIVKDSTDDQILEKLDKLDELVSQLKTNPSSSLQKEKIQKKKKVSTKASKQAIDPNFAKLNSSSFLRPIALGTRIQKNHRQERKNKPYEITSRLNSIDDLPNNGVYNVPDGPSKSTKIVAKVPQILKRESEAKPFFNWEQDKFDDTTNKNTESKLTQPTLEWEQSVLEDINADESQTFKSFNLSNVSP